MIQIIDIKKEGRDGLFEKLARRSGLDSGNDVLEAVEKIIADVRAGGDNAVLEYTRRFDCADFDAADMKVSRAELDEAYKTAAPGLIGVIRRAAENIRDFHEKQLEKSWFTPQKEGVLLGQLFTPIEKVGVYVPAGTAPLPSTVLMNAIPARTAGVGKIVMATPPAKNGKADPAILVAASEAGVDEIYKVGGAQAIASLAFGTATVPKVDKIVGPGNIFVATAKKMVFGYCDIDMIAGPSEIAIIADDSANSVFVAADLLSQAEHDILASSVLVTTSRRLAAETPREIEKQLPLLGRRDIAGQSINQFGAVVIVESLEEAVELVNEIAPEHLELCVNEPFSLLGDIRNAGAVFLGHYAPEPLGDYFAGPNHVLPTNGTARFFSPLNVADFVKKTSVISYTRKALERVKNDVVTFAEAEGLGAHANAVRVRFE